LLFAVDDTTVGATPDASASLSVAVINLNELPSNHLPGGAFVNQGGTLVFSGAMGNGISVSDADGIITVVTDLRVTSGTLRLGSTANVTVSGDGTDSIRLDGSTAAITLALDGLTFTPRPDFVGTVTLVMDTNDQGCCGRGWNTDVSIYMDHDETTIIVAADTTAPWVIGVDSMTADGTYGAGNIIRITVTASEVLSVGGTPLLRLETGVEDAVASYVSGSGTATLVFQYAVMANHKSPDLDCTGKAALTLNGGTIRDRAGNDADLTLPTPGSSQSLGAHRAIVIRSVYGRFLAVVDARVPGWGWGMWDLMGAYTTTAAGRPLTLNLAHDEKGKLSGTATCTVAPNVAVTMPIKGRVRGVAGSVTLKGTLKGSNAAQPASVSLTFTLAVDAANRQLVGRLVGNVRTSTESARVDEVMTLPIAGDMDGTWALEFDLDQSGRRVTGTAELTLSNLVKHAFVVRGKTGARNTAILSLAGDPSDPDAGAISFRTTITPTPDGWAIPESLSGKGYGQAVGW
jgi:hypothetical protein